MDSQPWELSRAVRPKLIGFEPKMITNYIPRLQLLADAAIKSIGEKLQHHFEW